MISSDGVRGDWTRRLRERRWSLLREREKTHSSSLLQVPGRAILDPCPPLPLQVPERTHPPSLISTFLFLFFFMNGGLGERERVCVLVQRETRLGLGFLEVLQRTHALLVVTVADHDHAFHFLPDLDDDLVSQKLDAVVSVGDL